MSETDAQQPASSSSKAKGRFLSRGWKFVYAVSAVLTALAAIVTSSNTLRSFLFPHKAASGAHIVAEMESDITFQEYDKDLQLRPASTAAVLGGASSRPDIRNSFSIYAGRVTPRPVAGRLVAVSFEGETKTAETKSAEAKIKEEGEKIKEEAKRDEEDAAREKARVAAEQKSAEAREQEEQKKEQEDQKRVEETQAQDAAQAKAEQAKAEKAGKKAKTADETVQAKRREAVRSPTQRRIEGGTSAGRVEEVLHEAGVAERCRPTCALKPIIEKALKNTSGNTTTAALEVRTVATRGSGASVHFEVTLKGLEHKEVVLTYALVQNSGPPPPEPYQGRVTIKTFAPKSEEEAVVGSRWVAVPSNSQEYHLELTVVDSEKEVAFHDTSPFQ
jgi:hypothetical protein